MDTITRRFRKSEGYSIHVQWPPLRYFVGSVFIGIESVLVEKDAHISSGGVSGLSIGIADCVHINAGLANLCIKGMIFALVYSFGGRLAACWTLLGAAITGVTMWLTEETGFHLNWPHWVSFEFILLFAKLPIGLLVSKGYSIGGFTAVAQLMEKYLGISLSRGLICLNVLAVVDNQKTSIMRQGGASTKGSGQPKPMPHRRVNGCHKQRQKHGFCVHSVKIIGSRKGGQ